MELQDFLDNQMSLASSVIVQYYTDEKEPIFASDHGVHRFQLARSMFDGII